MPSTTLLLATLLGTMSFFQGTFALRASSTSSLVSESTNSFGSPLSSASESTTALGEPVQATSTAVVPLAAPFNSTTSEPLDSESHVSSRGPVLPFVQFYSDYECKGPQINNRITMEFEVCHHVDDESAKASSMSIYLAPDSPKNVTLHWFNTPLCSKNLDRWGLLHLRSGGTPVNSGGHYMERPSEIHSINFNVSK